MNFSFRIIEPIANEQPPFNQNTGSTRFDRFTLPSPFQRLNLLKPCRKSESFIPCGYSMWCDMSSSENFCSFINTDARSHSSRNSSLMQGETQANSYNTPRSSSGVGDSNASWIATQGTQPWSSTS